MYINSGECSQFLLKGIITQNALLEIRKRGDLFYNKSPMSGNDFDNLKEWEVWNVDLYPRT